MNLRNTIRIYAGGPGSGCKGPNCGRKHGFIGNLDHDNMKEMGKLPEDGEYLNSKGTAFLVTPKGDVHRESDVLGKGFHEHIELAWALYEQDPKKFAWLGKIFNSVKNEGFTAKYSALLGIFSAGGMRVYCVTGHRGVGAEAGVEMGRLSEKMISRAETVMSNLPTDSFHADWWDEKGDHKEAEGTAKEILKEMRKSFYKS